MKTIITNIKVIATLSILMVFNSCDIDDVKPINQLTPEIAVRDQESAQMVLNGVYDLGRAFDVAYFPLHMAAFGNEGRISGFLTGQRGFNTNEVPVDNVFLSNLYNGHYKIINNANFLIGELEAGKAVGIDETKKMQMISEGKFQRALSYFKLLRYFGEFYNLNSEYGVVVRTDYATNLDAQARNSVQEVYNLIQSDLEYAVLNGPTFVEHYYSGSLASKALLAKVKLYIGDYENAALLAQEVINNAEGYALEAQYADIFTKRFASSEVIFAPFSGLGEGGSKMDQVSRTTYSESLRVIADAQVGLPNDGDFFGLESNYDPRFDFAYSFATKGTNQNGKYPFQDVTTSENNTMYHLRLAEIYLVHAEAEARRVGGDLDAAIGSLNSIRNRAGVEPKELSDLPTLLEDIRQEKLLELFFENNEPWFDVVRFDVLGNLDASLVKVTLTSKSKFILPIPKQAIAGNK